MTWRSSNSPKLNRESSPLINKKFLRRIIVGLPPRYLSRVIISRMLHLLRENWKIDLIGKWIIILYGLWNNLFKWLFCNYIISLSYFRDCIHAPQWNRFRSLVSVLAMKIYPNSRVAVTGYRHYKWSAPRTWRHPPDASMRPLPRNTPGLGRSRRAQSAIHTMMQRSALHTAHRPRNTGRGRMKEERKQESGEEETAKEDSAYPSKPSEQPSAPVVWAKRKGRKRDGTSVRKCEGRRYEKRRQRARGWTDEQMDGRTDVRVDEPCGSANVCGRELTCKRDEARVEGQWVRERVGGSLRHGLGGGRRVVQ